MFKECKTREEFDQAVQEARRRVACECTGLTWPADFTVAQFNGAKAVSLLCRTCYQVAGVEVHGVL